MLFSCMNPRRQFGLSLAGRSGNSENPRSCNSSPPASNLIHSKRLMANTTPLESTLTEPRRVARNSFKTCDFRPFTINTYAFFRRNPFGFTTCTKTWGGESYLALERGRPMPRFYMSRLAINGSENMVAIGSARPKGEWEFISRRLRLRDSTGFHYLGNQSRPFDISKQGNPLIAHGCTLLIHGARAGRARALLGARSIEVWRSDA
jgi:hypothetical protein